MTPDQVLDGAADYIDKHGHALGQLRIGDAACAIGGLLQVPCSIEVAIEAMNELRACVRAGIPEWNDANDHQTVTSTMRAVAATLRAQRGSETPTVTDGRSVETRQDEVVCAP